MNKVNWLS